MCKSLHVSVAFVLIPVLLDLELFLVFEFVLFDFFIDFFFGFGLEVSLVKVQYLELSFHEFHFDGMTHELLHFLEGQLFFQDLKLLKPVVVRGVKHGFLEFDGNSSLFEGGFHLFLEVVVLFEVVDFANTVLEDVVALVCVFELFGWWIL